jgi:hypothetical protein
MSFPLQTEFREAINDLDIKWNIKALVDEEDYVYSLTHDSKVIGPLFEIASAPAIRWVAEDNGMEVVPAENQNLAPDFSLINDNLLESEDRMKKGDEIIAIRGNQISDRDDVEEAIDGIDGDETVSCRVERDSNTVRLELRKSEFNKIGIDIKSTYRERYQRAYNGHDAGDVKPFDWTLGGYRSFLRKPTKNIQYDYRCYKENWVIGFLYTRNEELEQGVIVEYEDKNEIPKPHENVEFFVNEKYKVAGTGILEQ